MRSVKSCSSPIICVLVAAILHGCETTGGSKAYEESVPRLVMESVEGNGYGRVIRMPVSEVRIPVESSAILSEYDISSVEVSEVEMGKCLIFQFTRAASRDLYRKMVGRQGMRIVLLVNGSPVGLARMSRPVSDGALPIFVEAPDDTLFELARNIRATIADYQRKLRD